VVYKLYPTRVFSIPSKKSSRMIPAISFSSFWLRTQSSATGQQRMFTPPWHLILHVPSHCWGSVLLCTPFCIRFLDYNYVWHIVDLAVLYRKHDRLHQTAKHRRDHKYYLSTEFQDIALCLTDKKVNVLSNMINFFHRYLIVNVF
jgi:hypothetical protein